MKIVGKIVRLFMYSLPVVLFFSYYPVIQLANGSAMNYELSLLILWLVGFDLCCLIIICLGKKWREVFLDIRYGWRWLVFPIFVSLSVLWSANVARGVLTVGLMWLIVIAIYGLLKTKKDFYDERVFDYKIWRVFLVATLVICGWCVVQSMLDAFGVGRERTLMCVGCVSQMFGFPHPNGFAIEPQFMGNLLLAPAIATAWLVMWKRKRYKNHTDSYYLRPGFVLLCFFVVTATLFLTFSRGAIYAFIVGMMFMTGFVLAKWKMWKHVLIVWSVVILAFAVTLNFQGFLTQIGPTNDNYGDGVAKVLNHLSLGIVDVRGGEVVENPVENFEEGNAEAVFDGYVEESTDIRLELNRNAVMIWGWDFRTMLFGVGIGGAGQAMYERGLTGTPKEIVQNEYFSLLAETGIVGLGLFVWLLLLVTKKFMKSKEAGMLLSLLLAYLVSLMFFSGLPNALQIYLMPVMFLMICDGVIDRKEGGIKGRNGKN